MFFNVCLHKMRAHFHFLLIGRNLIAQSTGSHRGNGGGIQIPGDVVALQAPLYNYYNMEDDCMQSDLMDA